MLFISFSVYRVENADFVFASFRSEFCVANQVFTAYLELTQFSLAPKINLVKQSNPSNYQKEKPSSINVFTFQALFEEKIKSYETGQLYEESNIFIVGEVG